MKFLNILLVTSSPPTMNLGGPGKFVSLLMEAVHTNNDNAFFNVQVEALMQKKLYKNFKDLKKDLELEYSEKLKEKELLIKKFIRAFLYYLYIPGKLRLDWLHLKQQKMYETVFRTNQYDVIHTHDFLATVLMHKISRYSSIPIIFTNHYKGSLYRESIAQEYSFYRTHLWKEYFQKIEKEAINIADIITFPSKSAMNLLIEDFPQLEDMIRSKSKIIYTGIPDPLCLIGRETLTTEQKLRSKVINIGNHIPDKGVDLALYVFRSLLEMSGKNLQFINFGKYSSETPNLYNLAKKLGIKEKVLFKGVVPYKEVLKSISEALVVIHTPKRVVFDLSLLEVIALGVPVIATRVLGNEEALGIEYPLLVPVDNPHLSQEQIKILFEKEEEIGRYLRLRYEKNFTVSKMLEEYVKLWIDLAENPIQRRNCYGECEK